MERGVVENVADDEVVFDGGLDDDVTSAKNELKSLFSQNSFRQTRQDPLEAVADQQDFRKRLHGPVGPEEVVGQVLRTVRKVEQGSVEAFVLSFLVPGFDRKVEAP